MHFGLCKDCPLGFPVNFLPFERKGKMLSISRGAKCLRLPLTLVGDSDAQLIYSDPPQNADSFRLCKRHFTGACKGKMENCAVYADKDLSSLFQIFMFVYRL